MAHLEVIDVPGFEPYEKTLALQESLVEEKSADHSDQDTVIYVEHDHVYTVGRGVPFQRTEQLVGTGRHKKAIDWVEVGRGGQATYHGPGQLVAYPIFDLNRHGKDVHVFLRRLEKVIIDLLGGFGITGFAREGLTGVWVRDLSTGEPKKIASIGVGVRKWISYHGLALNVATDLQHFRAISACGQDGSVMTSMAEVAPERFSADSGTTEVRQALTAAFQREFGFDTSLFIPRAPRPKWLKAKAPGSPTYRETHGIVHDLKLVTVCEEAHCPNIGECWSHKTATFMIMGELCTRRCSFCAVKDGTLESLKPLDGLEPRRVAVAIKELGLKHVVITSVNRDDIEDMGAEHFNQTVKAIRHLNPDCRVELLIPDMRGRKPLVETILKSGFVSVLNHNVETVPRLYRTVRPGADFSRSLNILRWARELHPSTMTKSGLMVGLGEKREEVLEVMDMLRESDVQILTIGQYLQPTDKQLPIQAYVTPAQFKDYEDEAIKRGFPHVESGPLVRSSYHAWKHADGASENIRAVY